MQLAGLERDNIINLYNMLQRLRNGDGDSESEEQVSGPGLYIDGEANCNDSSSDEETDEQAHNNHEEDPFIDNSVQPDDTPTVHRQHENERRDREQHSEEDMSVATFSFGDDFGNVTLMDLDESTRQQEKELNQYCS